VALAASGASAQVAPSAEVRGVAPKWEAAGWGGGGFYWSAAFHPTQDGVIYLGGDVAGVYKTVDRGRNWRLVNNGLANYAVYSLAVDRMNPQTVYAATEGGLCKSTDGGEHWQLLPRTGRNGLRLTGERNRSTRSIAVDPTNGSIVYAGSPSGKIYKSTDGGQNWLAVYDPAVGSEPPGTLRVQFGKVNGEFFGGFWSPLTVPTTLLRRMPPALAFMFKGDGQPAAGRLPHAEDCCGRAVPEQEPERAVQGHTVARCRLQAGDFISTPHTPGRTRKPPKPRRPRRWSTVNRMDFASSGPLPTTSTVGKFGKFFFTRRPAAGAALAFATPREFTIDRAPQSYGNIRIGEPQAGSVLSVAVAPKNSATILAVTQDRGLLQSQDAGKTWSALSTPAQVLAAAFDPSNPRVLYAGFDKGQGIAKSSDGGATWTASAVGIAPQASFREIVVSPANPQDVYAIASAGWNGSFYASHDGGKTWKNSSAMTTDPVGNPTLPGESATGIMPLSTPTNLAINPLNPRELFISANWRNCLSQDAGATWTERDSGADISVITDVRFSNGRVYASAMDEGALVSENNGRQWRQMWPLKWAPDFSGHNWRLAVTPQNGVDRIIATSSPWEAQHVPRVIVSEDGGKSYKVSTSGLPDYIIKPNTMWSVGHPRALAVDPKNPQIVYLGIDGDAAEGKSGGGIFKSQDGGATWKQLPNQPGSRRMFYGLAVDPTDSRRIFWAACGTNGGLWRSEDGGDSWKRVFSNEEWLFNLMVARDGTVYCPGKNLWRSTDHGNTWKKISDFKGDGTIVGLEEDPRDPRTLWVSVTTWDASSNGGVYKTVDAGATWQEITGDLPYVKPQILRFNPATNELWAAGVGLFKLKQ
jgi:photosystem II stability/assembly factor-like uncharacterized protein